MVKGFLFDYDGVMTRPAENDPAARLAENIGRSKQAVIEGFGPIWPAYIRGALAEEAFWRQLGKALHTTVAPPQRTIWSTYESLRPLPQMLNLVAELRAAEFPVVLLSNATPTTAADLRAHGAYEPFTHTVVSSETGVAKPDEAAFRRAMEYLPGLAVQEVVFVDDQMRNIQPAVGLHMQTILATSPEQVIQEVRVLAGIL